ncbi:hypothetical protein IMCC9480_449 [Oxalobacteraceae bacterium IMCC9480]|nr:hypothetical protein IMCC9480_449 [Oxalobacteraceae bacterium IMCC9480]
MTPAFALVDARQHGDVWLPDADDLELPVELPDTNHAVQTT